jgi:two-component system, NtrC family, nitrogen regulation sensor histidine kinase NtrY
LKNFTLIVVLQIVCIAILLWVSAYYHIKGHILLTILFLAFSLIVIYTLISFVNTTNRKLKIFFESIQYEDFAITFKADNKKGKSFQSLNESMNAVIKSFNHVRAEREASLHFIQAIVQHITIGIISYTHDGKVELANQAILQLLGIRRLTNISELENQFPEIHATIVNIKSNESKLIKHLNQELQFSIKDTILRDRKIRLVAVHNIRSELQSRELEAWQNLTKVLRHEIMNSLTPIVSLSETMKEIIVHDLNTDDGNKRQESIDDLSSSINSVIHRSKSIMNFVNAYREFTNVPAPQLNKIKVSDILREVATIYHANATMNISYDIKNDFELEVDQEQIEQVLINLIKNAVEACIQVINPNIKIVASLEKQKKTITISDNGEGIKEENMDKIFIPFYTSKEQGSGIGLSLSKQIMQMHGGSLAYAKNSSGGAVFTLVF